MQSFFGFRSSIVSDSRFFAPTASTNPSRDRSRLSVVLGKRVSFADIPDMAMRDALLSFGFPVWQADGLIEDYAHYRRGEASGIYTSIQDVTGAAPGATQTLRQPGFCGQLP